MQLGLGDDRVTTFQDDDVYCPFESYEEPHYEELSNLSDEELYGRPSQSVAEACNLNDEQLYAATFKGNMMCLAGAGSGKTQTSAVRVCMLLEAGVLPKDILLLTFTRKATNEMGERVEELSEGRGKGVHRGTFHSWCARRLRQMMKFNKTPIEGRDCSFTIATDAVRKKIVRSIMEEPSFLALDGSDEYVETKGNRTSYKTSLFLGMHDKRKSDGYDLLMEGMHTAESTLIQGYEEAMRSNNSMDFSDLINIAIRYFQQDLNARPSYKHIIVDEFQDTSEVQYDLLRMIAGEAVVFAVGDGDQSIYEWRSAKPKNIDKFILGYDAKLATLANNYRSSASIVLGANEMIAHNKNRIPKTMVPALQQEGGIRYVEPNSEEEQARMITKDILSRKGNSSEGNVSIGILYRKNAHSLPIERELAMQGVSYDVRKDSGFLKRKEIQNVFIFLEAAANRSNILSLSISMSLMCKGISVKKSILIADALRGGAACRSLHGSGSAFRLSYAGLDSEYWPVEVGGVKLTAPARESLGKMRCIMSMARRHTVQDLTTFLLEPEIKVLFTKVSGDTPEKHTERNENYDIFLGWLSKYKNVGSFLEALTLDVAAEVDSRVSVSLMTIHASKGLEFDYVYLVNASNEEFIGRCDERWQYEESRRLMYVAITRARKEVFILSPKFKEVFMKNSKTKKSYKAKVPVLHCHFVEEISPANMPARPSKEGAKHDYMEFLSDSESSLETEPG